MRKLTFNSEQVSSVNCTLGFVHGLIRNFRERRPRLRGDISPVRAREHWATRQLLGQGYREMLGLRPARRTAEHVHDSVHEGRGFELLFCPERHSITVPVLPRAGMLP